MEASTTHLGRRVLGVCAAGALALGVAACGSGGSTRLVVAGWGGQLDEATRTAYLNEFDAARHADTRLVDAPGEQLARIRAQAEAHKVEWDAVDSLDGGTAYRLYHEGMLSRLPAALYARLRRELGPANVTPFGFAHGGVADVMVCNTARVAHCPGSMTDFYNAGLYPQPHMLSRIDPLQTAATAEVAKGWRISETGVNPIDVLALFDELTSVIPSVRALWHTEAQQLRLMRNGTVTMGLMWSNLAYQLAAEGVPLKVTWLGGAYEPRYWAVLAGAPHAEAAFELLEWIADHPAAEARWAEITHASVPNPAARARLPAALTAHLADYPTNRAQLGMPGIGWYSSHGGELDAEFQDMLHGHYASQFAAAG
jgi:putative spermidine/putrescine transport system substrate-binding protein